MLPLLAIVAAVAQVAPGNVAGVQIEAVNVTAPPPEDSAARRRRSPYRLDPEVDVSTDTKTRALQTDGGQCAVVGARLCTQKPRTVFQTDFTR